MWAKLAVMSLVISGCLALPFTINGIPDCRDGDDNKLYPDPYDCNKYWQCSGNGPQHKSCPPGLHFDPDIQVIR